MWNVIRRGSRVFVMVAAIGIGCAAQAAEHWQTGAPEPDVVSAEHPAGGGQEQLAPKRRPDSHASVEEVRKDSEAQGGREIRVRYSEQKDGEGPRK
jgi:hypothetical protein